MTDNQTAPPSLILYKAVIHSHTSHYFFPLPFPLPLPLPLPFPFLALLLLAIFPPGNRFFLTTPSSSSPFGSWLPLGASSLPFAGVVSGRFGDGEGGREEPADEVENRRAGDEERFWGEVDTESM